MRREDEGKKWSNNAKEDGRSLIVKFGEMIGIGGQSTPSTDVLKKLGANDLF